MKKIFFIAIGILIAFGLFFMFTGKLQTTGNVIGGSGNNIEIPLLEISENANWYEYNLNGVQIKYFAVRAKDGSIKTAFDACDVCFGSKKGYSQDGDVMVCNNCGNRYPISGLGTQNLRGGGCWPGYLASRIEGDNLIIEISDLKKGEYKFQ